MNQPSEYVRSDTPDPRVGAFNVEDVSAVSPLADISSAWPYMGTNNSALKSAVWNRSLSNDFKWTPTPVGVHDGSVFYHGANNFKQKRPWQKDDRHPDDSPPCKVHVNEEKVAQQFDSMSLYPGASKQSPYPPTVAVSPPETFSASVSAMWDRFHELENKLNSGGDIEIDEGVDMGGDGDTVSSSDSSDAQLPSLHISPHLTAKLSVNNLPQILVPKPCKEVVLWQPSGVELIKDCVTRADSPQACVSDKEEPKASRRKKTAMRTMTSSPSLLSVPAIRADTPPPNAKTNPLSEDIPVCFIEEPRNDLQMDFQ